MKNYAVTEEEKQRFIKKYTVYDIVGERYENEPEKKIYITLGNGKKHIIPYTEENENLVKARMKRQIREYVKVYKTIEEQTGISSYEFKNITSDLPFIPFSKEYLEKIQKQEEIIDKITKFFIGTTLVVGISTLLWIEHIVSILIKYNIPVTFVTIPMSIYPLIPSTILLKHFQKKYDLVKNYYYLENEHIYQNDYSIENTTLNLSRKSTKYLENLERPISINDLDYFSLSDLKHLKENIERYQDFGFQEEVKKHQLVLK